MPLLLPNHPPTASRPRRTAMMVWILVAVLVLAAVWAYRWLRMLRRRVREAWAQLEVALTRRLHRLPWSLIGRVCRFRPIEYVVLDLPDVPGGAVLGQRVS